MHSFPTHQRCLPVVRIDGARPGIHSNSALASSEIFHGLLCDFVERQCLLRSHGCECKDRSRELQLVESREPKLDHLGPN